jgi:hypothetical protein
LDNAKKKISNACVTLKRKSREIFDFRFFFISHLHPGPLFIPAALVSKFFETFAKIFAAQHKRGIGGIKDTGGHTFPETYIDSGEICTKFGTRVNAGGKLLPVSLTPVIKKDAETNRHRPR